MLCSPCTSGLRLSPERRKGVISVIPALSRNPGDALFAMHFWTPAFTRETERSYCLRCRSMEIGNFQPSSVAALRIASAMAVIKPGSRPDKRPSRSYPHFAHEGPVCVSVFPSICRCPTNSSLVSIGISVSRFSFVFENPDRFLSLPHCPRKGSNRSLCCHSCWCGSFRILGPRRCV